MLSKAHLTSHSRMCGSRWVITLSWLSGLWRSFLYSSSVYSCHLLLISSAYDSWESLGLQGDQTVHPKGDQFWVIIGRTDVEAETTILWPLDAKSWLIWKDHDAGKDWEQEEKGTTEDEMVGWYHQLNEHGFGWTLEVVDGQGGLVCCSSWGLKESDVTEWLNWTELNSLIVVDEVTEMQKKKQTV